MDVEKNVYIRRKEKQGQTSQKRKWKESEDKRRIENKIEEIRINFSEILRIIKNTYLKVTRRKKLIRNIKVK